MRTPLAVLKDAGAPDSLRTAIAGVLIALALSPWLDISIGSVVLKEAVAPYVGVIAGILFLLLFVPFLPFKEPWEASESEAGRGGHGGGGNATGKRSKVLGGRGGKGGGERTGRGGDGGGGDATGEYSTVVGGDGGDAGRADGRGGAGGPSPLKRLPSETLHKFGLTGNEGYGQGGTARNSAAYDRALRVLSGISADYVAKYADAPVVPMPGVLMPPADWVNNRLEKMGEAFRVEIIDNGTDFFIQHGEEQQ